MFSCLNPWSQRPVGQRALEKEATRLRAVATQASAVAAATQSDHDEQIAVAALEAACGAEQIVAQITISRHHAALTTFTHLAARHLDAMNHPRVDMSLIDAMLASDPLDEVRVDIPTKGPAPPSYFTTASEDPK